MRDNGTKEREMATVSLPRGMVTISKDIGSMISAKDRDHISTATRISFSLESGSMINPRLVSIPKSRMRMPTRDPKSLSFKILMFYLKFQN
jgi:hypothetical protein